MFRTILVHVDSLNESGDRLSLAIDLAHQFDATLIGLAACASQDHSHLDPSLLEAEFSQAAARFKTAAEGLGLAAEWRVESDAPSLAIIRAATAADLIVLGAGDHVPIGASHSAFAGDVVLRTGRPILVVPEGCDRMKVENVLVAWKESSGAQRAIADSIPFLKRAGSVVIVQIEEGEMTAHSLADPEGFLARHGIVARTLILPREKNGIDEQILTFANRSQADIIVAGAYGQTRLREWVLGGVTRGLLMHSPIPCLLSH